MRSSDMAAAALAAIVPGLFGCAQIAGLEDRQAFELVTIARDQPGPHAIALDEEAVYWITEGNGGPEGEFQGGALRRQSKDHLEVIDLIAPSQEAPHAIAVDATQIYWSTTDLAYSHNCAELEDGDPNKDRDKLWRLSKQAPFPAASGETLWGSCGEAVAIALNDANVYSARPGAEGITWIPKDGSSSRKWLVQDTVPAGVAADGDHVYWTDDKAEEIYVADVSETEPKVSTVTDTTAGPHQIVLDAENLYWLTSDNVMRRPRSASRDEESVPLLEVPVRPHGIAAHGDYLYVTDREAGVVYKIRKDRSAPEIQIARGQREPTGIAADETGVYWTNTASGEIVRYYDY
ncbi:hypothetical protein SOCE26_053550 [Sorangium cellulosum]|uniref:Lipoprotein n=1 Tax=Sorangium cellulosum TaxID=56 RepID=A0A2L0EXD2_SORCE|nr:hypothetical protein [Sorangium cellulosum]AUX43899.1 hypothetical protein SOCE26_053550 [Sorangium cellulosum]